MFAGEMYAEALNVFAPACCSRREMFAPAVEGKIGNGSWEEEQQYTQPGKPLFGIG